MSYRMDAGVLVLACTTAPTDEERRNFYRAIVLDSTVPLAAPILLDVRKAEGLYGVRDFQHRLQFMAAALEEKLGRCAVLVLKNSLWRTTVFLGAANDFGLTAALFVDEEAARRWLVGSALDQDDSHGPARR